MNDQEKQLRKLEAELRVKATPTGYPSEMGEAAWGECLFYRTVADKLAAILDQPEPQDTELRERPVSDNKKRDAVYHQIRAWVWKQYPGHWDDARVVDFVLWREQELARAQQPPAELRESGWLIENAESMWASLIYVPYKHFKWTRDSWKALRFSRKVDAEAVIQFMQSSEALKATEHVWIGTESAPAQRTEPDTWMVGTASLLESMALVTLGDDVPIKKRVILDIVMELRARAQGGELQARLEEARMSPHEGKCGCLRRGSGIECDCARGKRIAKLERLAEVGKQPHPFDTFGDV